MAPIGEKVDRNNGFDEDNEDGEENLWATILDEVQSSSVNKLPSCKSVLVLGENESGKTTLIAKLQNNEDPKKGSGLEYTYINVKDEYRDDQTRLGMWILDGDLHHRSLLRYALPKDSFPHTLVMLVVSMAQPWSIMESLQRWAEVLSTHIDRLKLNPQDRRDHEEQLVKEFQQYEEPSAEGEAPTKRKSKTDEEQVLLPLGETTLTHNLGIPIIVVVTKSDAISTLEKEHDYREENFDFIQSSLRKFCLNYGAALFYTSVKEDKNCDLLLRYMLHRIYHFPFTTPAFVVERDAVFVPFGWDTENKISILYESMTNIKPDDPYEDVITKPVTRKTIQRDAEVTAEDEQVFLMKEQANQSKMPQTRPTDVGGSRPSPTVSKTSSTPRPTVTGAGPSPGKKPSLDSGKPGANASEGVLANFFNSLLHKKTGAATPSSKSERTSVSRDAAAELDRMTRTKKPTTSSSSTPPPAATPNNTPSS